jgi:Carboxypeptidase regulatory-like domain
MMKKIGKFLRRGIVSMRSSGVASIFVLATVLAVPTVARSQQDVGTIGGTVADPTGNIVANAKVTIRNDATGLKYEAITNDGGFYQSQPLPPGKYTVIIIAAGFSSFCDPECGRGRRGARDHECAASDRRG